MDPAQAACSTRIVDEDPELAVTLFVATATLRGEPLLVVLYGTEPEVAVNGPYRLYTIDAPTCRPVAGGVQTLD
jgi:hypothetical protein